MKKTLRNYRAALIALALLTLAFTFAAVAQDAPPAGVAVVVPDSATVPTNSVPAKTGIVNWAQTNWQGVVAAFMALIIAARLIVKLTPTPKDDSALEKLVNLLKHVGLHVDPKK